MDRTDVKKSQAKVISEALFPNVNYLYRLKTRMEKVGFPHDDKLYQLVSNAYDAMHRLSVEVHYLSCDGVGRATPKEDSDAAKPIDTS